MRETKAQGRIAKSSSKALTRALRLAAIVLGIGIVLSAGAARAQEDEDDDSTFEERLIRNLMSGLGATNMEHKGIDYRERSPLVVPPKIDLPPPASASTEINAANWPKDPDQAARKAAIAERKKRINPFDSARTLTPSELNAGGKMAPAGSSAGNDSTTPGGDALKNPVLSPSELGYTGGLKNLLMGGNKTEAATFKGEPTRDSLTQPPPGYQTPSPNYAYGVGPSEEQHRVKKYDGATGKYDN